MIYNKAFAKKRALREVNWQGLEILYLRTSGIVRKKRMFIGKNKIHQVFAKQPSPTGRSHGYFNISSSSSSSSSSSKNLKSDYLK